MRDEQRFKRRDALRRQARRVEKRITALDRVSRRFSSVRLVLVFGGVGITAVTNYFWGVPAVWIVAGIIAAGFVVVARFHDRVEDGLKRHGFWRRIKSTHLARMNLDWEKLLVPSSAPSAPDHPFDGDLNLTGTRSLHQLLNTTGSLGGCERLRDWLTAPTIDTDTIRQRQELVAELCGLPLFRDKLTLKGVQVSDDMDARWDGLNVCRWLERHRPTLSLKPYLMILALLSFTTLLLYVMFALILIPAWWPISFAVYALTYVALYSVKRSEMDRLDADASLLETVLRPFQSVLLYLESFPMDRTPRLAAHCVPLHSAGSTPSSLLHEISWIAGGAKWQKGQFLWLILNALVPWDLYFTYRLHRFRERLSEHLPAWLETWYDLEAYCALASFAYLNPDSVMPEVPATVSQQAPVFSATGLSHPFLTSEDRVSNDFSLASVHDVAIITGSNMSGKSTFLRTIGINLCLAYAGGPVLARAFRATPFRLFTSMKISDSVTDGISYFYAEVRRLKALLQELDSPDGWPLFFMIDEIFRGTNNRERLLGSRAYIRAVVEKRGVGLVSTHDLELVTLEDEIRGLKNYHFREDVRDGAMVFDYRLREGPCPTTNALEIMRLEGLPIEGDGGDRPR